MNPELKKTFQEKRQARFQEIQAKALQAKLSRLHLNNNTSLNVSRSTPANKKPPKLPVIRQTKASQLRLEKNNPFHNVDLETLRQKLQTCSEANKSNAERESQLSQTTTKSILPCKSEPTNVFAKPRPIRRSISAHFKYKKSFKPNGILKSCSTENLSMSNKSVRFTLPVEDESPNLANISLSGRQAMQCLSPKNEAEYESPVTHTPLPSDLREKLVQWLEEQGISIESFPFLRTFGLPKTIPYRRSTIFIPNDDDSDEDENKENVPTITIAATSEEDFPKIIDYTNFTTNEDTMGTPTGKEDREVAMGLLEDLHSLILNKLPLNDCENWLLALKKKFPCISNSYKYWECRAAIDAVNGELGQAVHSYEEAIVQGAEVDVIEERIDQLLEKFSLLNVNTPLREQESSVKKKKVKAVIDARNIFKSNIIKFAVQKRSNKKKSSTELSGEQSLIVTPVRRSSRLSIRENTNRPGQVFDSFNQLSPAEREKLIFKNNIALDY